MPSDEFDEVQRTVGGDLRVIAVDTLQEALDALASLGGDRGLARAGGRRPGSIAEPARPPEARGTARTHVGHRRTGAVRGGVRAVPRVARRRGVLRSCAPICWSSGRSPARRRARLPRPRHRRAAQRLAGVRRSHRPGVVALRLGGIVLLAAPRPSWQHDRGGRELLRIGLVALVLAEVALSNDQASTVADVARGLGALSIGAASSGASARVISARIAATGAMILFAVITAVAVALLHGGQRQHRGRGPQPLRRARRERGVGDHRRGHRACCRRPTCSRRSCRRRRR